jgi:hypothetical protein
MNNRPSISVTLTICGTEQILCCANDRSNIDDDRLLQQLNVVLRHENMKQWLIDEINKKVIAFDYCKAVIVTSSNVVNVFDMLIYKKRYVEAIKLIHNSGLKHNDIAKYKINALIEIVKNDSLVSLYPLIKDMINTADLFFIVLKYGTKQHMPIFGKQSFLINYEEITSILGITYTLLPDLAYHPLAIAISYNNISIVQYYLNDYPNKPEIINVLTESWDAVTISPEMVAFLQNYINTKTEDKYHQKQQELIKKNLIRPQSDKQKIYQCLTDEQYEQLLEEL